MLWIILGEHKIKDLKEEASVSSEADPFRTKSFENISQLTSRGYAPVLVLVIYALLVATPTD